MSDLRCVISLTSRPLLVLLLQSVLCASWALPLVSGSTTFKRNGTTPGLEKAAMSGGASELSYRAGRNARSFGLAPFGLGSGGREEGFYDSNEFSLYPTQWGDTPYNTESWQIPKRDSELVRLVEGEFDQDVESQPFTDQPFLRDHQKGTDGDDEDLRLFSTEQGEYDDEIHHREMLGDPFAQGQAGSFDTVSYFPDSLDDGEVYDQRTSSHIPSSPNQSQVEEGDLIVMAATPTLTRVSEFVRGMLQRFGVSRKTADTVQSGDDGRRAGGGLSSSIQRLIPHRFRPHFVNTSKGLRNIPHQLNDGQLQLAPEDAPSGSPTAGGQSNGAAGAAGGTTKQPGSSGTIGTLFNSFKRKLKAIYPGTVWCGDGNQAKSEDDIGFFYLTDSCCRAHDLCPITIAAGEQFNRLKNNGHFTRSHCDCDKKFYNCLKNANTLVSRQIGYTYFNLLKPQCFRHEHPKVDCTKRSRGKCLTYVVDEKHPKQWQWFDNLIF